MAKKCPYEYEIAKLIKELDRLYKAHNLLCELVGQELGFLMSYPEYGFGTRWPRKPIQSTTRHFARTEPEDADNPEEQ